MQPRRIARELALLSIGQLSVSAELSDIQEIESAITAAIRTLSGEIRDAIEVASADLNRSSDRLLDSDIKTTDIHSAREMLKDAIASTQTAINRLGATLELPEFIQVSQLPEVKEFAYMLIKSCRQRRTELDEILTEALEDWKLSRLAKIDRNILRIAVAEFHFLEIPQRVAINEAVELAKRYSNEDGHRFINGVLRRVTRNLDEANGDSNAGSTPETKAQPPIDPWATRLPSQD